MTKKFLATSVFVMIITVVIGFASQPSMEKSLADWKFHQDLTAWTDCVEREADSHWIVLERAVITGRQPYIYIAMWWSSRDEKPHWDLFSAMGSCRKKYAPWAIQIVVDMVVLRNQYVVESRSYQVVAELGIMFVVPEEQLDVVAGMSSDKTVETLVNLYLAGEIVAEGYTPETKPYFPVRGWEYKLSKAIRLYKSREATK